MAFQNAKTLLPLVSLSEATQMRLTSVSNCEFILPVVSNHDLHVAQFVSFDDFFVLYVRKHLFTRMEEILQI